MMQPIRRNAWSGPRLRAVFVLSCLALLVSASGCWTERQSAVSPDVELAEGAAPESVPVEPASVNARILAAARTPVSYDAENGAAAGRWDARTGTWSIAAWNPAEGSPTDSAAGTNSGSDAAGTPSAGQPVGEASNGTSSADGASLSVSRMGLITMRKIIVAESPTRRPVADRERDRRESPSDKRGEKTPSPAPSPSRERLSR